MDSSADPIDWYQDQVVFLTGATGSLGGCLLYKLAVQLPTKKIYVLCRGSMRQAIEKWEISMPEQTDEILDTGKVHCFSGDITHSNLGLGPHELEKLQSEVTVVIHAAADFSLFQELPVTICCNCLSVVALARLLLSFHKIKIFLQVSSITTQSFLPGGSVLEQMEQIETDEKPPQMQLEEILTTGKSPYTELFMAPYAQAKYLAEKLLLEMKASFPILIVRPASIGPAIRDPYPLYGPEGAIPLHTFLQVLLESGEYRGFDDVISMPQEFIIDEIPVDLVANTCLLHLATGTVGVVHAASQLYVSVTFGEYVNQIRRYAPKSLVEKVVKMRLERNHNFANQAADMLQRVTKEWLIDCSRSRHLKETEGPIGLALAGHDFEAFSRRRVEQRARNMESWVR
ncbi:male sterility protein [Penicillium angulare]|uniref:Fatty acyl-CoA reductase n=1 Tax=Penicillium angulare TaxID=116970 RepID=A0A9W9FBJ2_9EURO|nr:male sterility protein [Penicillium angulare]